MQTNFGSISHINIWRDIMNNTILVEYCFATKDEFYLTLENDVSRDECLSLISEKWKNYKTDYQKYFIKPLNWIKILLIKFPHILKLANKESLRGSAALP